MATQEVLVVLQKDSGIHKGIPTGSNVSSEGSRGPVGLLAIEKVLKVVEEFPRGHKRGSSVPSEGCINPGGSLLIEGSRSH